MNKYLKVSLLFLITCAVLSAQMVEKQGVGRINYDGRFNKVEDRQFAIKQAKLNALQAVVASFETAKAKEYSKIRALVEADLDRYVPSFIELDDELDKKEKTFVVVIRAKVNLMEIEREIAKVSAVANVSEEDRSYLTFVFLSRKAATVKQFDAKVTKREDSNVVEETTETQAVGGQTVALSGDTYKSKSTTTGGATEVKSDKITYEVSSSDDINTTVLRVFGDAGYEAIEAEMVADETEGKMDLEAFKYDFSNGEDISAATRKGAAEGCRDLDIRFLAIGKLDIGQNIKDPVTGMTRVYVNVNAKVYDVSKRFPKTVASVGPVQFSGLGPTQDVAQRNALQTSGNKAASDLVSQMRSKNLF